MNVLFTAEIDFASVSYFLAEALTRAGHPSRVVTQVPQRFGLPNDMVISQGADRDEYKQLLKESDMIVSASGYHEFRPFGIPFPSNKITAIWNGGTNYRQNFKHYEENVFPLYDIKYAHWDLSPLSKHNHVLNQPIDTDKYKFIRRASFGKVLSIGHIPSGNNKGTNIFYKAMSELEKVYRFNLTVRSDMDHKDVMREKRKFHIYFDQILDQHVPFPARRPYGCAAVEAMALGGVVLCGCDTPESAPIGRVFDSDQIKNALVPFLEGDFELWDFLSHKSREWAVKNHSYDAVVNQFLKPLEGKI